MMPRLGSVIPLLPLLLGLFWLLQRMAPTMAEPVRDAAQSLAAVVAVVSSIGAARRSRGAERLAWQGLGAGSALTAAAQTLYLLDRWSGSHLLAATPVIHTGWAFLYYVVFVSFYWTPFLQPHLDPGRRVPPATVMDGLLLSHLLLSSHFYFFLAYRLSGADVDRPGAGLLMAGLLGLGAASWLWVCRRQASEPRWKRIYGLVAAASLCQAVKEGTFILRHDPAGGSASWILVGDWCQMVAFSLIALAGITTGEAREGSQTPAAGPGQDPLLPGVWRDLAVPLLVLPGLLSIPVVDRILFRVPLFAAEHLLLRDRLLAVLLSLYVVLLLVRQLLVQLENRSLVVHLKRESEKLRLLVTHIHDAVVIEDLEGRIVFANDRFLELFALDRIAVASRRLDDFIHPDDRRPQRLAHCRGEWSDSAPIGFEFRAIRPDGAVVYFESLVAPIRHGAQVIGFQSVIRNITERRRAEGQQRELAQRLEFLVSNMPLGCIVFDLDFRILEWNSSAARIFGWTATEVFGRSGLELLVPEEIRPSVAELWEELRQTRSANHRFNANLTKTRGRVECEWFNTSLVDQTGEVVAIVSMVQDITERKNLEAELRHAQKMQAIGTLASGIAHDFNNLLTSILGNVVLTIQRLGPGHPATPGLLDAEKASERGAELVRQLLSFTSKSVIGRGVIDLNHCVRETAALLRSTLDARTRIEVHEQPQCWLVEADSNQIQQVLMNLCVNARDAMPEGGRLTLTTANRILDRDWCARFAQGRPGEFVEFAVSDTGHGMDPVTLARVFEPFFTTKEVGKGTGLGLAMVYGIVEQHGGWVSAESTPGQGSTFSVFLPRVHAAVKPQTNLLAHGRTHGVETVLLVEDEDMIRTLARAVLENKGYTVLVARDGDEALATFRENQYRVDLVLLDFTTPGRSGPEALPELRRLRPRLPVIVTSGYALTDSTEGLQALGASGFLQKPYDPATLAATVRQVLDAFHSKEADLTTIVTPECAPAETG